MSSKPHFRWEDPLLLEEQLSEDERLIQNTARDYATDKLLPRIVEANRHESFDREIMTEMPSWMTSPRLTPMRNSIRRS